MNDRLRVLDLKRTGLEVKINQAGRLLSSVAIQIGKQEGLLAQRANRFSSVRTRVLMLKGNNENPAALHCQSYGLVNEACAVNRDIGRIDGTIKVLNGRRDEQGRVLGVLKNRSEFVDCSLSRERSIRRELISMGELDYLASTLSLRRSVQGGESGGSGSAPPNAAGIPLSPETGERVYEGNDASGSRGTPGTGTGYAPEKGSPGVDVRYTAGDGSGFQITVDKAGRGIMVTVLPDREGDRPVIRAHAADLADALTSRGYRVRSLTVGHRRRDRGAER